MRVLVLGCTGLTGPHVVRRLHQRGHRVTVPHRGRVVPAPFAELPHDFAHHLVVDTTRILHERGYAEIVGREEGLARTIAWERS